MSALFKTEVFTPKSGQDKAPRIAELATQCAADFAGVDVPPRRWIIEGFVPERNVTLFSGDGAAGKSTLAIQLAVGIAASGRWLGLAAARGAVVYASCEDDLDEIHRRVASIARAETIDMSALRSLHFIPLAGEDALMGVTGGKSGSIVETPIWRGLVAVVKRLRPRVVILDPLADIFGGDENHRGQARQFIAMCRTLAIRYDLAVILIAHPSLSGLASGSGLSGSTAWSNSVRSRLYLKCVKADAADGVDHDARTLSVEKANFSRKGGEIRLRWADGRFIVDGPSGPQAGMIADAKAERVFLDLLAHFVDAGRSVSDKPSPAYAPKLFAAHPNSQGLSKRALGAAMERLFAVKRIAIVDSDGPPSRRFKRLVVAP